MKIIYLELEQIEEIPDYLPTSVKVIEDCSNDIKTTWAEAMAADEIYFSSTFLSNGSSVLSSSELFSMLIQRAVNEGIKGKKVYCCSDLHSLNTKRIDSTLFKNCFYSDNSFFARTETGWKQIFEL